MLFQQLGDAIVGGSRTIEGYQFQVRIQVLHFEDNHHSQFLPAVAGRVTGSP